MQKLWTTSHSRNFSWALFACMVQTTAGMHKGSASVHAVDSCTLYVDAVRDASVLECFFDAALHALQGRAGQEYEADRLTRLAREATSCFWWLLCAPS